MKNISLRTSLPARIKMNLNAEILPTASQENCSVITSGTAEWTTDLTKWIVNFVNKG